MHVVYKVEVSESALLAHVANMSTRARVTAQRSSRMNRHRAVKAFTGQCIASSGIYVVGLENSFLLYAPMVRKEYTLPKRVCTSAYECLHVSMSFCPHDGHPQTALRLCGWAQAKSLIPWRMVAMRV